MNNSRNPHRMAGSGPLQFFVYSNLFIAACAVLMVYQTSKILLHTLPDFHFVIFVFCATICSYSFHWWLTPDIELDSSRLRWLKKYRNVHLALFIAGLAGAAWYGSLLLNHWPWLLLAALTTFLYSAPKIPHPWFRVLRKVALGKTIFLAFVWMYVTTVLPLQLSDQPWRNDFYLFAGSRFFLIYALCIVFDYRDRAYDRSIGIRSLITWLSERGITMLFVVSLLLFAGFTLWMLWFGYSYKTAGLLLVPGLILAVLYKPVTKKFSDIVYYLLLDGLMALSAMLTLIAGV
jgi:4-hydroxybenzoate polyprenyltransferase